MFRQFFPTSFSLSSVSMFVSDNLFLFSFICLFIYLFIYLFTYSFVCLVSAVNVNSCYSPCITVVVVDFTSESESESLRLDDVSPNVRTTYETWLPAGRHSHRTGLALVQLFFFYN